MVAQVSVYLNSKRFGRRSRIFLCDFSTGRARRGNADAPQERLHVLGQHRKFIRRPPLLLEATRLATVSCLTALNWEHSVRSMSERRPITRPRHGHYTRSRRPDRPRTAQRSCRLDRLDGSAGIMRLHDHSVKIEKSVVNVGFVPEHVEAGAGAGRFGQSMTPTGLRNDRKGWRADVSGGLAECAASFEFKRSASARR